MKSTPKFWMVWAPQGRAPTYKHFTRQSADAEAERLSANNPEWDFFVLKVVGGFNAPASAPAAITITAKDPDGEIPF